MEETRESGSSGRLIEPSITKAKAQWPARMLVFCPMCNAVLLPPDLTGLQVCTHCAWSSKASGTDADTADQPVADTRPPSLSDHPIEPGTKKTDVQRLMGRPAGVLYRDSNAGQEEACLLYLRGDLRFKVYIDSSDDARVDQIHGWVYDAKGNHIWQKVKGIDVERGSIVTHFYDLLVDDQWPDEYAALVAKPAVTSSQERGPDATCRDSTKILFIANYSPKGEQLPAHALDQILKGTCATGYARIVVANLSSPLSGDHQAKELFADWIRDQGLAFPSRLERVQIKFNNGTVDWMVCVPDLLGTTSRRGRYQ